ncbi:uncharacterized protein LOC110861869 [Folsomia candida]|uniref:uncharacterized protein LOC110861869 n=1 Tax=Folsomia candida TaxID=158441 RepID=UPI000B8FB45E|nr:uncharacterized protein LOC110861869 [Folsomia candida]
MNSFGVFCIFATVLFDTSEAYVSNRTGFANIAEEGSKPQIPGKSVKGRDGLEISTTCGDVLTTTQGRIEYTSGYTVGTEYCVFMIKSRLLNEFNFDILQMDVYGNRETFLGISTFDYRNPNHQTYQVSQLGKYKSTGNLVILGFTTSRTIPIYRRVFVLEYSMTPIGDLELSANSVQNIYPGVHGNPPARFRYPQADVNYDNREFTALVFAPPNWINYDTSNRKSRFEVNTSGLEASCTDKVSTYTMSSTVSAVGSSKRELCNATSARYDANPVYVVVFKSDNATVGAGFNIEYDWGPED